MILVSHPLANLSFSQCLQEPVIASEAATALQNICSQCRQHMADHFLGLIQILEQIDKFNLKPEAANGLIKGVVMIISIMNNNAQLAEAVEKVCLIQVTPLSRILDGVGEAAGEQRKVVKHSVEDPVLYLDRLSAVFRHVQPCASSRSPAHPCRQTIESLWPVLSRCLHLYKNDVRITERTCRAIRFAIRCIGVQSSNLLLPLVTQMVELYQEKSHSCYLYLGSILVDEYAGESGCIPGLLSMLQAFITPTYTILRGGLVAHPDTVDDFFRLNARFLQRAPVPYLQTEFIKSILECALLSATLEHRDANASVMKFFFDLLHAGRTKEDKEDFDTRSKLIKTLHTEYGEKLVDSLVKAAVTLPSYTYHDLADVIHESLLHDRVRSPSLPSLTIILTHCRRRCVPGWRSVSGACRAPATVGQQPG